MTSSDLCVIMVLAVKDRELQTFLNTLSVEITLLTTIVKGKHYGKKEKSKNTNTNRERTKCL